MARYSKASQDALSWQPIQYWDAVGGQLRQRDAQRARQNHNIIQQERVSMAKKEASGEQLAEVVKLARGNSAAAQTLVDNLVAGRIELSVGADGKLSVMADEMSDSVPARTGTSLTSTMKPTNAIDPKTAYKEIQQIAGSREGTIALQKRATAQSLTPREAKLIERHDALMAANKTQAREERPPLPSTYPTQPEFASRRIRDLVANPDGFARVNDAREAIAEIRATPNHPAYDPHAINHKSALAEVHQLYQIGYPPESYPTEMLEGKKE